MKQTNNYKRLGHIERMVIDLHSKINSLLRASNLELEMEYYQMADFTELVNKVEKMRGAAASTNVFIEGLKKQISDLAADMNEEEDQAKVMALAADIDAISGTLPQAIAENPAPVEPAPVEPAPEPVVEPAPAGSMADIDEVVA